MFVKYSLKKIHETELIQNSRNITEGCASFTDEARFNGKRHGREIPDDVNSDVLRYNARTSTATNWSLCRISRHRRLADTRENIGTPAR